MKIVTESSFYFRLITIFTIFILLYAPPASSNKLGLRIPPPPEISGGAAMSRINISSTLNKNDNYYNSSILSSPYLLINFDAINFDGNHANTGNYHIPPDPIGVAGLNHVVNVVNTSIEWYTKTGTNQNSQSLSGFFTSLNPLTKTFDPKVIYDQYADRFVVVTLEVTDIANGDPANTSRIMMAVSDDNDPNGNWYYYAINSKLIADGDTSWADYPGLAIDNEAVYVTSNMYTFDSSLYRSTFLWIIDKGLGSNGFYNGGSANVSQYDPYGAVGFSQYAQTTQPAHMFGSGPSGVGTFLISYGGLNDGTNEFVQIIRVNDPLNTPTFNHQFLNVGNIENSSAFPLPDAPQMNSSKEIEVNDRRLLHAVWRNNSLWATTQVLPSSGPNLNQTTAHWWKFNTTNLNSIIVADQGDLGGEDIAAGTSTFFPSVAVNMNGDMGIGFSASAPTIFPGAYYTWHKAGDPAGTVQPSQTLRAGVDYYFRAFGGARNRWGDYSGMSVDPSDDLTFWVFNEYAMSRGSVIPQWPNEDGCWATAFGSFTAGPVVVDDPVNLLNKFVLYQNYPNPFNPTTTIRFEISNLEFVNLNIYDINGKLVRNLLSENKAPGIYKVNWDGRNNTGNEVSSGAYFYKLSAGDLLEIRKMLLIR